MKSFIVFIKHLFELVGVIVCTYCLPAFAVGVVFFDPMLYLKIVTNPTYAAVMLIMSIISVVYYVDWKLKRVKKIAADKQRF